MDQNYADDENTPVSDQRRALPRVVCLSANSVDAVKSLKSQMFNDIPLQHKSHVEDMLYTLYCRRPALAHRTAYVTSCSEDDAAQKKDEDLETPTTTVAIKGLATNQRVMIERPVVLLFPGQGSQHRNMGFEMLAYPDRFPVFQAALGQLLCCCPEMADVQGGLCGLGAFNPSAGELYGDGDAADGKPKKMKISNRSTQLALFSLEYCMAMTAMHQFGIHPT